MKNKIPSSRGRILSRIAAFAAAAVIAFPQGAFAQDEIEKNIEFFNATKSYILNNYAAEDITEEQLIDAAVKGMFDALDPHSTYLSSEQSDQFNEEIDGSFTGIGALVGIRDGRVMVIEPLEDSPAIKAGLLPGDIIRAVDGEDVTGTDEIADIVKKIKGEEGSSVNLTIERNGSRFNVSVTRANVTMNPVKYKVIEQGTGYIKLSEFSSTSIKGMDEAVKALKKDGIDKLVLDLRGNPGGGLVDVVAIAQDFVPKGSIVTVKYKDGAQSSYPSYGAPVFSKVAVLVDNGSASASEILAGAIQDTKSGVLIGENTYGKGTVQKLLELKNGEAIKLTIAKYVLPSGRSIDHAGLVPDIQEQRFKSDLVDIEKLSAFDTGHEMKQGDAGLDVLALQERLKLFGYEITDAKGIYGETTGAAVAKYKQNKGIGEDNVANISTLSMISSDFSKLMMSDNMDNQLQKALEYLRK